MSEQEPNTEGGEALPETRGHTTEHSTSCRLGGLVADGRSEAWYAIWTRSNCERLVAAQLAVKGFSPFLPEMHIRTRRRGAPAIARAPMFPGYLFVHLAMDKERYVEVLKVPGIVRILEDGWTRLTPIPDADINSIQRVVRADMPVFAHPYLSPGERVSIVEGPLTGLEGVFVRGKTNKGCFVISIDLLGRSVAVELNDRAVVPISSYRAA